MTTSAPSVPHAHSDEAQRAFLQRRVAIFCLVNSAILSVGLIFRVGATVFTQRLAAVIEPTFAYQLLATLVFTACWLATRSGSRSVAFVRTTETTALVGGGAALAVMTSHIPLGGSPYMVLVMTTTFLMFARAIWVPSTARRTLMLGLFLGLPMAPTVFWAFANAPPESVFFGGRLSHAQMGGFFVAVTYMYWSVSVVLCVGASRVIYGLRKEVRDVRELGQYTLEAKIGDGGMGIVYRARHGMLRRTTAVKLLQTEKAGEAAVARFEREVQLTARLSHPNTVTIFDYGRTPDGVFYYAMELLRGATLEEVVDLNGPQEPSRVIKILVEAAGALREAHELGLIHRDIKPANIMLCEQGGVRDVTKVLDFGLAKEMIAPADAGLSTASTITGTPHYMSPEAITDPHDLDARSDLYALGAVGYYLLTGQHLFEGESVMKICVQQVSGDPGPPSARLKGEVPADLEALIMTCLAKDRDQRPASAAELQRALRACSDHGGWSGEWWWDEYGEALKQNMMLQSPATDATLEIDLVRRRAKPAGTEV